uniref:Uncharacterized protein n=1 Tax=Oryza brachyantha TaxID=4533 RepID=J3MSP2_ORYBR
MLHVRIDRSTSKENIGRPELFNALRLVTVVWNWEKKKERNCKRMDTEADTWVLLSLTQNRDNRWRVCWSKP